jgi:hydrogenase maturation protein HypF
LLDNKAFISQHIGDVENVETRDFLENTIEHLRHLTNSKIDAVACDLHPKFTTTRLAHDLAEKEDWRMFQVQHHYAHVAALMVEHDIEETIGVCCDGYGYGLNGEAWGGEILLCTRESFDFDRVAHLEKQPLVGGDLATRYPLRMAAGILSKEIDVEKWLLQNEKHLPHGAEEAKTIIHQLEKNRVDNETTSCGRVLDATAAILGVCYERTYEGEPSMKLESVATKGKDALKLEPILKGDTLDTTQIVRNVFENRGKLSKKDLAYSVHAYLAKGLAMLAIEKALENGAKAVGFSGGVAYNRIFTYLMRRIVHDAGLSFLVHEAIPPGDGGLSFGQAVAVGFSDF